MTMNRHEAFEELISASLQGDLTPDERRRLDAHLDGCAQCRATLAAFSDQRRIIAGLRHVGPPRDLGARVRAGIEYANVPWWRRPTAIFTAVGGTLAAVTGALLALVVLNGTTDEPPVGNLSPTPTIVATPGASQTPPAAVPTPSPITTLPTPPPPGETPAPTPTPDPNATPNPIANSSPEPDLYVAVAAGTTDQLTVVDPTAVKPPVEPTEAPAGQPLAAELSPDGGWLAMVSEDGLSGATSTSVSRVADATQSGDPGATPIPEPDIAIAATVDLGDSTVGSPFLKRLAWAPDGSALAYTLADQNGGGTDVWVFDRASGQRWQLTDTGDAYAGSWVIPAETDGGAAAPELWVSRAEGTVTSYLLSPMSTDGTRLERIDPATEARVTADHVFQPIVSPNGSLAIYWDGVMTRSDGGEWLFSEGGAPYLAEHRLDDGEEPFQSARPLFSDVTIDRDAFTSAAIAWGWDSDTYAVWNAEWTGIPQSSGTEDPYPDRARVYFGHASDPRGLTRFHAIDRDDLPADGSVVDVKVSPTGRHLVVTVRMPTPGDLAAPEARLLLITRNTDDVPDIVEPIAEGDGQWFGPAVFDGFVEIPRDASGQEPGASPGASGTP